jgi:hypothetical protein
MPQRGAEHEHAPSHAYRNVIPPLASGSIELGKQSTIVIGTPNDYNGYLSRIGRHSR